MSSFVPADGRPYQRDPGATAPAPEPTRAPVPEAPAPELETPAADPDGSTAAPLPEQPTADDTADAESSGS